jgi:NAD(P)-dependent dehydrogenase (short-subunit alcohol dehydrogenase family)
MNQSPLNGRLEGLTAVITGAGHGIGRAYARRLGQEGANVVVADVDGAAAQTVAKELQAEGISSLATSTDVAEVAQVGLMAAGALDRFGRIDILVNNAAMMKTVPLGPGGIDVVESAQFELILKVNVVGALLCMQAVVPDMRRRRYGKIINISSTRAFVAPPGRSAGSMIHYSSSKAAILGMTKAAARELGADGIRVNCVAPGSTFSDDTYAEEKRAAAERKPQVEERCIRALQTPGDLVGTVAFLASHDSDFVTGQTIVVDGGIVMH